MKQKEPDLKAGTPRGPHSISELTSMPSYVGVTAAVRGLSEDGQGHAGPAVTETHRSKVSKLGLRNGSFLQGGYCSCYELPPRSLAALSTGEATVREPLWGPGSSWGWAAVPLEGTDGGAGNTPRSQSLNMNLPFSLMPCGLLPTAGSVPGPSQGPFPDMVRGAW